MSQKQDNSEQGGMLKFYVQEKSVGMHVLGIMQFHQTKRPCWFHRVMVKLILGIEWKDLQ